MKILFLNAYFYPENIAFSHLEKDIIRGLQQAGHRISVVCPIPCRGIPEETIREFRHKKTEEHHGIHIDRYWAPREGKNPAVRAFRYFWCSFKGNRAAKKHHDADLIFAVSTPPTQGYFAGKLAKKLGIPFVYSLQDVFPDSLVTTGLTSRGSLLYRLGARIEKKTYPRCSRIIVLSDTARRNLLDKGVPADKLTTVGNWIDTDRVRPVERSENRLFDEYGADRSAFTVVYAGNFGASQGTQVILSAAKLLRDTDVRFVLFGAGAEYDRAVETVKQEQLSHVTINPLLPPERVAEVYSMGDVALITCKKGVGQTGLPSKLWSIMACGTPVIAAFDAESELAETLSRAGAGCCVEPENAQALADAVRQAYEERRGRTAARDYVTAHASKDECVARYVRCIEEAAKDENNDM